VDKNELNENKPQTVGYILVFKRRECGIHLRNNLREQVCSICLRKDAVLGNDSSVMWVGARNGKKCKVSIFVYDMYTPKDKFENWLTCSNGIVKHYIIIGPILLTEISRGSMFPQA